MARSSPSFLPPAALKPPSGRASAPSAANGIRSNGAQTQRCLRVAAGPRGRRLGRSPWRSRRPSTSPVQSSGLAELDRVLGGGFVPGSVTLLGGDPGIGKSTLLLQVAASVAP